MGSWQGEKVSAESRGCGTHLDPETMNTGVAISNILRLLLLLL